MSLPLRSDPARAAVLNIFPEGTAREKARPLTEFRAMARPTPAPIVASEPVRDEASMMAQRNSQTAFELLEQASNVIPVLMARCRQLESDVATAREKARSDMEAAELVAQRYQTIVQELQARIMGLESELSVMTERAEGAERHNETIQIAADRTRQHAAEAECLTALFHDKVMAALGNDSPAHAVLQALRQSSMVAVQKGRVA